MAFIVSSLLVLSYENFREFLDKMCRCDGMVDVADSKSAGGDTVWVRAPPPVPNKQRPHPGVLLISCLWGSNPRALSKALGALCNPRRPAAHGRSSPTTGTTSSQASYRLRRLFMLRIKSHLALTPLLLLSKLSPLRWASIWLYHTPLPKQAAPPLGDASRLLQFAV